MPRPSNTEQRRRQIVQGLMTAMADKGYEKASIQSIAKAAGLSPGLIHYHFKTKQDILLALTEQLSQQAQQRFQQRLPANADARATLCAWIDAALALGEGSDPQAVASWVMIGAEAVRLTEVRQLYRRIIDQQQALLCQLLQQLAQQRGETISASQASEAATFAIASIEGAYQLATTAPGSAQGYAARWLKQALGLIQ